MRRGSEVIDLGAVRRAVSGVLAAPLTATLVALGIPAIAMAQNAPAAGDAAPAATAPDAAAAAPEAAPAGEEKSAAPASSTELSTVHVTASSISAAVNPTTGSTFGFAKPILEQPRSITFLDTDTLNLMGINGVQDIMRAVPGTYTTTRYGLQGGTNIRGVQADQYFRGMKRLFLQGHSRTDFNGLDTLEIVEGPPSPLFGMGSMGGYINVYPKSARASTGAFLSDYTGFAQATVGSYQKTEGQIGAGGPMDIAGKHGGFYLFGLLEDSNSYMDDIKNQQKIFQATGSLDDFIGPFRLEAGTQYQNSKTSGDYLTRTTQALVSNGLYVTGNPLVPLNSFQPGTVSGAGGIPITPFPTQTSAADSTALNLKGTDVNAVSFRETHINSPLGSYNGTNPDGFAVDCVSESKIKKYNPNAYFNTAPGTSYSYYAYLQPGCASPYGSLSGSLVQQDGTTYSQFSNGTPTNTNSVLSQTFQWPYNPTTHQYYMPGHFPSVPGIPLSMNIYLTALLSNPNVDPTGTSPLTTVLAYGQKNAANKNFGPIPISGWLPAGMVLDPRTTGFQHVNYHGTGTMERLQNANLNLFYVDLIDDKDPNFTIKNQIFSDNLVATKDSYEPYGEFLTQRSLEDKFTVTRRIDQYLPSWLNVNTLASFDWRLTHANKVSSSGTGDYDWRQDGLHEQGNDANLLHNSFTNWLDYPGYANGNPVDSNQWSSFDEFGFGFETDIDLFKDKSKIFKDTNIVLGGRWDGSNAQGYLYDAFLSTPSSGGYAEVTSQAIANNSSLIQPGVGLAAGATASAPPSATVCNQKNTAGSLQEAAQQYCQAWSHGTSYSISVSEALPYGFRPYATIAMASLTLDDSDNYLAPSVINPNSGSRYAGAPSEGHIGDSRLREVGMKNSFFHDSVTWSTAYFIQSRTDVTAPTDPTASANVSSTETKGWENKFTWAVSRKLYLSGWSFYQDAHYVYSSVSSVTLDGRMMGFQDIRDPNSGQVVFPAEAFTYGGKINVNIPPQLAYLYTKFNDAPDHTYGLSANYVLGHGFSVLGNMNFYQSMWADRIDEVKLPHATTVDSTLSYDMGRFHINLIGTNLFNKHYFQPGLGDTTPIYLTVFPGAQYQLKAKVTF